MTVDASRTAAKKRGTRKRTTTAGPKSAKDGWVPKTPPAARPDPGVPNVAFDADMPIWSALVAEHGDPRPALAGVGERIAAADAAVAEILARPWPDGAAGS